MADISTPTTARKTEDFTASQRQLVRDSLFIHDNPYQTEKTYIVFDADAGNNDLHIITGASSTYTITQGDGTQPVEYTDTGGTKVLNYAEAGRYLITIDGTFNGIDVTGSTQAAKDKYISVVGGSNYPTSLAVGAFDLCTNLEYACFDFVTTIGNNAFEDCSGLVSISFLSTTTIGDNSFKDCTSLITANFDLATSVGTNSFQNCESLVSVSFKLLTSIANAVFLNCDSLTEISFPAVTSIGTGSFQNCYSLKIVSFDLVTTVGDSSFRDCRNLITAMFRSATTVGLNSFENCHSLCNAVFEAATTTSLRSFFNCDSLTYAYFPSVTIIGVDSFRNSPLLYLTVQYTAGLSVGTNAFNGSNLADLYTPGAANGTEAATVQTKLTTAGMNQLTGYRLLY